MQKLVYPIADGDTLLVKKADDTFRYVDARALRPVQETVDTGILQERYYPSSNGGSPTHRITQTLVSPNYSGSTPLAGFQMRGDGMAGLSVVPTVISTGTTAFFWGGPSDTVDESTLADSTARIAYFTPRAMIHMRGNAWRIEDFTLIGYTNPAAIVGSASGCLTGIHCYTPSGIDSTDGTIESVVIGYCESAIRIGIDGTNQNDNLLIHKCTFSNNDDVVTIEGNQAVKNTMSECRVRGNRGAMVHAKGGGCFNVTNVDFDDNGTMLKVSASNTQLSHANGDFVFEKINMDNQSDPGSGNQLTLVDHVVGAGGNYIAMFRDLQFASITPPPVRATIRSANTRMHLVDCRRLPADTEFSVHDGARVYLRNCDLSAGVTAASLFAADSTNGVIDIVDCERSGQTTRLTDHATVGG